MKTITTQLKMFYSIHKHFVWAFIAIISIAFVTRFYQLGITPKWVTWDEAAIGYNGYAVAHTGRDEWVQKLPISFKSFGDYKAPATIYLNGFSTLIFGLNIWAVRFPFAFSGIIAIIGMGLLVFVILKNHPRRYLYSALASFFLLVTPWHFHFSRIGFETGIALAYLILGTTSIYYLLSREDRIEKSLRYLVTTLSLISFSAFMFALSLYTYHSAKISTPLIVISLAVLFLAKKVNLKTNIKILLTTAVLTTVLLIPLLYDIVYGYGLARANVLVISTEKSTVENLLLVISQFISHFSPAFLIDGKVDSFRHGDGKWGVLLWPQLILICVGILDLLLNGKKKNYLDNTLLQLFIVGIIFIYTGLIPSAISTYAPHANRALLALPGFILLMIVGTESLYQMLLRFVTVQKLTITPAKVLKRYIIVLILLVSNLFIAYIYSYFTEYKTKRIEPLLDGYLEAFTIAKEYEKGENGKPNAEKIVFTSEYGQPYIYALFVRKTNPYWYNGGSLVEYEFANEITIGDLSRKNALLVTGEKTFLSDQIEPLHVIYGSDGKPVFKMYYTEYSRK